MMLNKDILGIDFGTTNSKMAYMLLDEPVMIQNSEGKTMMPSTVYFKKENEVEVGEIAKRNIIVHPERTINSIKKEMGTDFRKKVGRYKFPPEYIAAQIFKKLSDDAEQRLGKRFRDAVVSVPANYSDGQRQSIKDSAEIAGLNVLRLINEPTAAALAYGIREDRDRRVLVYDFGGGTFDVTILTVSSGFFDKKFKITGGISKYIGNDFDRKFLENNGVEIKSIKNSITEISKNIYIITNFERYFNEKTNEQFYIKKADEYIVDLFNDEISIVIKGEEGLVVLVGCSHPDIRNIIMSVEKSFSEPILAVIGGTHLRNASDKRIMKTIEIFKELSIKKIGVSHCTGDRAVELFKKEMPNEFFKNNTGSVFEFN